MSDFLDSRKRCLKKRLGFSDKDFERLIDTVFDDPVWFIEEVRKEILRINGEEK